MCPNGTDGTWEIENGRENTDNGVALPLRNADRSKRAILDFARSEFAEFGLGGARMARIAEKANLDKKLIFYYFKNKENLYTQVILENYAKIRGAETELNLYDLSPKEAICRLTEFTWEYYLENPEFITLLNSENLHKARHISKSLDVQKLNSPLIDILRAVLQRGVECGEFKSDIDPIQLYISIAALSYFYLSNNHTLSTIFDRDLLSEQAQAERINHIRSIVLSYVSC